LKRTSRLAQRKPLTDDFDKQTGRFNSNNIITPDALGKHHQDAVSLISAIMAFELIRRHSFPSNHAQSGHLLPLAMDKSLFKRTAVWMRVPSIFPSVLTTSTAMCIDAMPSIPGVISQTPEQATKEHISNRHLNPILEIF
jgi:hypothetical protein